MARELTEKQEKFVAEFLSNGRNATAAYRAAYDCQNKKDTTIAPNASRLLRHPKVSATIDKADAKVGSPIDKVVKSRQEIAEKHEVTLDSLTEMTKAAYAKALADDKGAAAMVSAIQLMGKLHGLIIDKKESKNHNINETADTVKDDELAAIARSGSADPIGQARREAESDSLH